MIARYAEDVATPTYGVVCSELHAARQHLYDMVRPLSQAELQWLPPRPDGISISYHFGHIALVEDVEIGRVAEQPVLAPAGIRDAFGVHNVDNRDARFPSGAEIIDYMQSVRARTLQELAMAFRSVADDAAARIAAEPFRRIINHEYSHTKYIRRIRAEMGQAPVGPPTSELVQADEQAIAPPQYSIQRWDVLARAGGGS